MGVDNVLIELNGPEIPIIDGSSHPFVELIEDAGVTEQEAAKAWYSIEENIYYYDEEKRVEMTALPSTSYSLTTLIDFNSPVLGTQHAGLKDMRNLKQKLRPAVRFAFYMSWKCCWIITLLKVAISIMPS
jgi:UDP-3-O-[3-hydroxymyristoyl] N-acetylglucosamine deacetylase/3-hydroxyacyl-[acyl-carrier-protein] dehydratase